MNVLTTVKAGLIVAKNWTVKHSPELLLGLSLGSGVAATVSGCIATKKMEEINAKHKELIEKLHEAGETKDIEDPSRLFNETPEYKRALTKEYGRYGVEVAKTWAPCVGFTLLSGTSGHLVNRKECKMVYLIIIGILSGFLLAFGILHIFCMNRDAKIIQQYDAYVYVCAKMGRFCRF